jgi:hypothetical protein
VVKPAPIETGLEHGDTFPRAVRQRMGESLTGTTWLGSGPARILREPREISRKAMAL